MELILKNRFNININKNDLFIDEITTFNWDKYISDIPSISILYNSNDVKINNFHRNYTSLLTFSDLNFNFLVLDTSILDVVDKWMSKVFNKKGFGYYDDYASYNINVSLLGLNFGEVMTIRFYDCYPKVLSINTFNHQSNDILGLAVSFSFNRFEFIQNKNFIDNA